MQYLGRLFLYGSADQKDERLESLLVKPSKFLQKAECPFLKAVIRLLEFKTAGK